MRPPLRPPLAGVAALVLLATVSACGGGADLPPPTVPPAPDDAVVRLVALDFVPKEIRVPAGRRVVWQWTDQLVHNVIGEAFRSPNQAGGSYANTFTTPGTYRYQCTLHTGMVGTVVVEG